MVDRDHRSYEQAYDSFSWNNVYSDFDANAPAELNIGREVCDRHAADRTNTALVQVDENRERTDISFAELTERSDRFASVLEGIGVERGERLLTYLPRLPVHYSALVGTLKHGAVFGGINERYGPDGIKHRLNDSGASVLVTSTSNFDTIEDILDDIPSVERVLITDPDSSGTLPDDERVLALPNRLQATSGIYEPVPTSGEDPAILYYTSGTTGAPKGVLHNHQWLAGVVCQHRYAIDLREDDLYWSTADLGWLAGAITTLGSWFDGYRLFTYEGSFDPDVWAELLDEYPITVLYSIPTAYRMLRKNPEVLSDADLSLRHALSVGESLSEEVIEWGNHELGVTVHETYGQTELGTLIINNSPGMDVKPGSMGRPLPGVIIDVVDPDTGESVKRGESGELAVDPDYPSFYDRYWERPDQTAETMRDGWYMTGDLVRRDRDGYLWFKGRVDDLIISSGYRIGPAEVEHALEAHSAVVGAGVVPNPDPERGNIVKAYVVPEDGCDRTGELKEELQNYVRDELSAHEYPREITFIDELPKTTTGKIRRTALRGRE